MNSKRKNGNIFVVTNNQSLIHQLSSIFAQPLVSVEELPLRTDGVILAVIFEKEHSKYSDISWIRRECPTAFIAVLDPSAFELPLHRSNCFDAGANQVAHDVKSLLMTITECVLAVLPNPNTHGQGQGLGKYIDTSYACPYCGLRGLSEDELWR